MKKIQEVLRLHLEHGASRRQIAAACCIGRTTVGDYIARIHSAGLSWPSAGELSEGELQSLLFPVEEGVFKRPMPDFAQVHRELSRKGVTLKLLHEEYEAREPQAYSYSRFARYYGDWKRKSDVRMVQHHKAGQKMFVDWAGVQVQIADPATGEIRQAPVFVSCMGCSQYIFAKVYESMELRWWLAAHVDAFEDCAAVPEIVVPDNLKTGVQKACRFEPALNLSYGEFARFYGVAVLPARVRKPRDKSKVENAVQQVERWALAPLRDRVFFSVSEANEALAAKVDAINSRVMKGPNCSRRDLFEQEDKPAMRSLPEGRYVFAQWKQAKVAPDYHVEVDRHFYSVPFGLVGKQVDIRIAGSVVEVFEGRTRVASHLRAFGRRSYTTLETHMPEKHRAHAAWTPGRLTRWAATIGPSTAAFTQSLLEGKLHPEHGFRMCMGVLSLSKRFEPARVEAACSKALSLGALSYQSVKSILQKGLEGIGEHPEMAPLPAHSNVRGGEYYAKEAVCANSL